MYHLQPLVKKYLNLYSEFRLILSFYIDRYNAAQFTMRFN